MLFFLFILQQTCCIIRKELYICITQTVNKKIMKTLTANTTVTVIGTKGMFEGKIGVIVGTLQNYRFSVKFEDEKNPISICGYNLI